MPAPYDAPLEQIRTALDHAVRVSGLHALPAVQESLGDVTDSVLDNAARFAREVLSPLNPIGDRTPARCTPEGVTTSPGFADAYARFRADGWPSLGAPAEDGGMGLPVLVATACGEMWAGANLAFAMCPEVSVGAIEALRHHAPAQLRERYLPPLVSGEWTASMALTEPQSGSDLSTLRTRAEPDPSGDGSWRLFGRKIYISWGDHDFTENIVHLVLARTPGAPEGLKGISLFLVPKRVPAGASANPRAAADARRPNRSDHGRASHSHDGSGANDIRAISLEHKMGIRASPTCAMVLGEHDGARGWLIGALNDGLACMFTMMNTMRLGVGMHSLGVAERALQLARAHAHERRQGRTSAGPNRPIVEHADVRRMLLQMKALTQAARGLVYLTAATLDVAQFETDRLARGDADAGSTSAAASKDPTPPSPGGIPSSPGETAPSPGETPPSPGETPPSPGETPPNPGETPPSPGETPPSPGETPPSPGETPPSPGETPPSPGRKGSSLAATQLKRSQASPRASLLTPIVKAWVSEIAVEVASLGVQVHGGMGYVDDAEISQIYRDARIGPIFEGTNYIQSHDLLSRKVIRDGAVTLNALLDDIEHSAAELPADDAKLSALRSEMIVNCAHLSEVTTLLISASSSDPDLIGSVAHHYLQWLGVVLGGWQWCSYAASDADTAAFYAAHVLPRARMHEAIVRSGSTAVSAIPPESV